MEKPMENNSIFAAFDGDGIGNLVGRAVLADDVAGIKDISARIQAGQDAIAAWATSFGAEPISHGGDESSYQVPAEAMDSLEQVRKDYQYATGGMSCTVGVGMKLSEAGKALMVGKLRGKNQICQYDESVENDFNQAAQDTENGTAEGEAAKIGKAYMKKDEAVKQDAPAPATESDDHSDCPYCQELDSQGDSDPDHCGSCHDEGDDCPYCNEAASEDASHDPSSPDHESDCPYCQEADAEEVAGVDPLAEDAAAQGEAPPSEDQAITDDPSEHSQQGMQDMLNEIVNQDGEGNPLDASAPQDVDPSAEPVGADMQGNVSRPAGFNAAQPGDMGVEEQNTPNAQQPMDGGQEPAPDFGSVLQDGLEDHADSIQKERVMSMVVQALQGFKAAKGSLEQAKQQVPDLYSSSISMLQAMIEMAKLLGLENSPEGQPPGANPASPAPGQPAPAPAAAGVPPSPKLLG
jgi:hypothetical protein